MDGLLTPSDECESPQVVGVGEEGHEDEAVQVQPLHEDPVIVGCQEVDEQQYGNLAAHLTGNKSTSKASEYTCDAAVLLRRIENRCRAMEVPDWFVTTHHLPWGLSLCLWYRILDITLFISPGVKQLGGQLWCCGIIY